MDAGEKQYWFDVLPQMTAEQKDELFDTLVTEFRRSADPLGQELDSIGESLNPQPGSGP